MPNVPIGLATGSRLQIILIL